MQSIRQVARLNDLELEKCVPPNASWHTDYRDTAYIYIGGLPFELSEGDVLTIFSQYGNPVHINLVRDKETGKSRGFCFLKYEDQRSCDLAVDNLSGASVMGRMLSVDHTRYKKKEGEIEGEGLIDEEDADDTDREGDTRRKRRRTGESESGSEVERPLLKEEVELAKLRKEMDDDDPMKAYLLKEKEEEVAEALKAITLKKEHSERRKDRDKRHELRRHRHHRSKRRSTEGEDEDRDPGRTNGQRQRRYSSDEDENRSHERRKHYSSRHLARGDAEAYGREQIDRKPHKTLRNGNDADQTQLREDSRRNKRDISNGQESISDGSPEDKSRRHRIRNRSAYD